MTHRNNVIPIRPVPAPLSASAVNGEVIIKLSDGRGLRLSPEDALAWAHALETLAASAESQANAILARRMGWPDTDDTDA